MDPDGNFTLDDLMKTLWKTWDQAWQLTADDVREALTAHMYRESSHQRFFLTDLPEGNVRIGVASASSQKRKTANNAGTHYDSDQWSHDQRWSHGSKSYSQQTHEEATDHRNQYCNGSSSWNTDPIPRRTTAQCQGYQQYQYNNGSQKCHSKWPIGASDADQWHSQPWKRTRCINGNEWSSKGTSQPTHTNQCWRGDHMPWGEHEHKSSWSSGKRSAAEAASESHWTPRKKHRCK